MRNLNVAAFVFCSLSACNLVAADIPGLTALFRKTWESNYLRARCGVNIINFVTMAKKRKLNLDNAHIVNVEGAGFIIAPGARGTQWNASRLGEFHVVLLADNKIFDYDFGNAPQVLAPSEYLVAMYEREKLKHYSFTLYDANLYVRDPLEAQHHANKRSIKAFAPELELILSK